MFCAAVAAMILSLSACGGGQDEAKTPVAEFERAIATIPETGMTVSPVLQKAAKAPVAKPATVQSSGHKASAAPQAAVAGSVNFTVGVAVEKALPLQATTSTTATEGFMNWVERVFPGLFPGGHQETIDRGTFVFRYYPEGNSFLGVTNDGKVYVLFLNLTTELKYVGLMADIPCQVDPNMCPPKVTSVSPANGAVDVALVGTIVTAKFDQKLAACPVTTTGTFGVIQGTLSCVNTGTTATVTITPATELPENTFMTATLCGFSNTEGVEMVCHTWSFTTMKKPVVVPVPVRVYTANYGDFLSGTSVASVIDVATSGVTQIGFPTVPGFGDMRRVVVDSLMRKVYFGAIGTFRLYSIDLDTNAVLEPIAIDNDFNFSHSVMGLALSETDICMAFSRADVENYPRQNELECRNRMTLVSTFKSPAYFLADAKMMTTRLSYLPFGNDKKLYALNATKGAYFAETLPDGGFREGFSPDTVGTVVAIDAATKAITTIQVGSVPQGIDRDPVTGDVYVTNGGDGTISVISHATGQVEKVLLPTFTGFQRPIGIKVDRSRGKIYVTDYVGAVVVLDLVTRQEVARVPVGSRPVDMVPVGNLLYVACRRGTSVFVIDLDTLKVTRTIQVGTSPWGIASSAP